MTDVSSGPDPFDHTSGPDVCGLDGAPLASADSLGLHVPVGDGVLDLGSPEADLDGDGFMEAVTRDDGRGLTVYTDVDGDGTVDHISTVRFDGTYDSWRLANPTAGVPFGGFTNESGPAPASTSAPAPAPAGGGVTGPGADATAAEPRPDPARWERIQYGEI